MKRVTDAVFVLCLAALGAGCGGDGGGIPVLPDGDAVIVAVGSNFVDTSVLSRVVVPQMHVDVGGIEGVASFDPVIRKRGGYLFVINRFGFDNVTVLDASDYSLVGQISTGAGSNPQDVAILGDSVYVATQGGKGLVVFDLMDMGAGVVEIDLSSLDSSDGVPNCIAAEIVDGDVWVACKQLDDGDAMLSPRGNGLVAIVDASTNTLDTSLELEHEGPTGFFLRATPGGDVYLATVEDFMDPAGAGCIETLKTGVSPESDGCLIENSALGGYASDMESDGPGIWATVVSGFDDTDYGPMGSAGFINLGGNATYSVLTDPDVRAFDVAGCPGDYMVISDATKGLRVYFRTGAEVTSEPIDIGAPVISSGTICM